jgi:hypothetical protein
LAGAVNIEGEMERTEPLVGWRLWRLCRDRLHSWVTDHVWEPGDNNARCLVTGAPRCAHAPGIGCHCGFWAMTSPQRCLEALHVRVDRHGPFLTEHAVLGLMAGWGEVAIHGDEGFRSEVARPLLLLRDQVAPSWLSWRRRSRDAGLRRTADAYGIPLVSLESAIGNGVLRELGVPSRAIEEASRLLAPSLPRYPAGLHGGERQGS